MSKNHAVGILIQNRWDLTQKTLQSLYHTDQDKNSYDLYLIDNGSDPVVSNNLKEWVKSAIVPVKNLITVKEVPLAAAWNLFLSLTTEYQFRTKLDNDLIFANTPVASKPFERSGRNPHAASPGDYGTNPGAVQIASIVKGAGSKVIKHIKGNTCFLQHIEKAMSESNLGICAIPTVGVGQTMVLAMPHIGNMRWRNNPVLVGGCMSIPKKTFDQLGYFDEQLPCHIDWEYSQRAMGAGLNVGYTSKYCVIHLGETDSTCLPSVMQERDLAANKIGLSIDFKREFVHSKWEKLIPKITRAAAKSTIVNFT